MTLERKIMIQDCFKFEELYCFSRKEVGNQGLENESFRKIGYSWRKEMR